ncbi:hypothetical protein MUN88_06445 [Gracilibacillus caseinilyticus]|uniref:Uncharacterized protein n=1 Tax=Gracilibacillus caseinilyticus TaxID=2932256 RepID=A0ABY4F0T5_9BACI|nr:hypothetical protein [Gracilibacillus caseinilyticus]UOQ49713.1 hypothetical protein MUN88_06445 [Gracilibacillus caseinilyticus]
MNDIYHVFIIVALLALQYYVATRDNPYLGIIAPVLFLGWIIWRFTINDMESIVTCIIIVPIGWLILYAEWKSGRKYLEEKTEKELAKMKMHDLN